MRSHRRIFIEGFGYVYEDTAAPLIQQVINAESINLEVNYVLGNELECVTIKRRIAKAKIFSLVLSGDLPA